MHFIPFEMKRAYWGSLVLGRRLTKAAGLTPARFDLLYAMREWQFGDREVEQSTLRRALGVARVTVSRMLRRLEELGLVTRRPSRTDRRTKIVRMTDEGARRLDEAIGEAITSGVAHTTYCNIIGFDDPVTNMKEKMHACWVVLWNTAYTFGTRGMLQYPRPRFEAAA